MGYHKPNSLDQILFENVSYQNDGLDPVLVHVDLEFPMDQTIIIQSSNPTHSVHLLEILAGRKEPQSGNIKWTDTGSYEGRGMQTSLQELVASYFESNRPAPNTLVKDLLIGSSTNKKMIQSAVEYFEIADLLEKQFRLLSYEMQKLILLLLPTLKTPQMLILEDPAVGLSELTFLNYLDWIQMWQRQGHLRHIYLTNNHPTAARHLNADIMYVEDGLIYLEENEPYKKSFNF